MPASADLSGRDFDAALGGDAPVGLRAANLLSIEDLSPETLVNVITLPRSITRGTQTNERSNSRRLGHKPFRGFGHKPVRRAVKSSKAET